MFLITHFSVIASCTFIYNANVISCRRYFKFERLYAVNISCGVFQHCSIDRTPRLGIIPGARQFLSAAKKRLSSRCVVTDEKWRLAQKCDAEEKPFEGWKTTALQNGVDARFAAWNLILPHCSRGSDSGPLSLPSPSFLCPLWQPSSILSSAKPSFSHLTHDCTCHVATRKL